MLMQAMQAGGIPCLYDSSTDDSYNAAMTVDGYVPSPKGFFEMPGLAHFNLKDWSSLDGKCLKVMHRDVHRVPFGMPIQSVYIRRDVTEIIESGRCLVKGGVVNADTWNYLDHYDDRIKDATDLLANRGDVTTMNYPDVIADPTGSFKTLQTKGWPIDPVKAAGAVDPTLYRNRKP